MPADDIELRHIGKGQLDELIDAQNEIFSDYVVPMRSSKEFFLDFLQSVGGNVDNVIVALDRGKMVGYANPVLDGDEAWVGGVGVVPGHRGRDIGKRLMLAAEEFSESMGARRAFLEVIEGNLKALGLYQSLGYRETRRFVCAEGKPTHFVGYGDKPRRVPVEDVVPMHARTYKNTCWQRRKVHGLLSAGRNSECYMVDDGFVMVRKVEAAGYVPYLGVLPESRREGVGTSLAKFALNRLYELGAFKVAVYNLNEEPSVLRMLDKFDFSVTMKQIEMSKPLK